MTWMRVTWGNGFCGGASTKDVAEGGNMQGANLADSGDDDGAGAGGDTAADDDESSAATNMVGLAILALGAFHAIW